MNPYHEGKVWLRSVPLRVKLVAAVLTLVALALLVISSLTTYFLRNYLVGQVDNQIRSASSGLGQLLPGLRRGEVKAMLPSDYVVSLADDTGVYRPTYDDIRLDPGAWRPLWSVLLHVARNAVDHGIEPPDERSAAGKSRHGTLTLTARTHEAGFRLELTDDGRGIDWEQVRRTCEQQGRPSDSRAELIEALFFPGFSTRQRVSETSGRGVGLSAVLSVVRELGGTIELDSAYGQGTRLSCTFPHDAVLR